MAPRPVTPTIHYGPVPKGEERGEVDPILKHLSRLMDSQFEIPGLGIRFGLDALLGLLPGVGDTLSSLISLYILAAASRYGVSRATMARMGINVAADMLLGSLPIIGDVFDVAFKANNRNVELLRRSLAAAPDERRRGRRADWLFVGGMILLLIVLLAVSIALAWVFVWLLMRAFQAA